MAITIPLFADPSSATPFTPTTRPFVDADRFFRGIRWVRGRQLIVRFRDQIVLMERGTEAP